VGPNGEKLKLKFKKLKKSKLKIHSFHSFSLTQGKPTKK